MEECWKLKIYLAGHSKDKNYRKVIIDRYSDKCELIDPMTITWKMINKNIKTKLTDIWIVNRDKRLIDSCDILIANIEYLPYGEIHVETMMEIMYAFQKGISSFIISSSEQIRENPWLKAHSKKSFSTIYDCFEYILN